MTFALVATMPHVSVEDEVARARAAAGRQPRGNRYPKLIPEHGRVYFVQVPATMRRS